MPQPVFSLETSGTDPKSTTKQILETEMNRVVGILYDQANPEDRDAAALSAEEALTSETNAATSEAIALAAANAAGPTVIYDTKAAADAALSGLANGTVIEVSIDESRAGQRTRYRKTGGVYVFGLVVGVPATPPRAVVETGVPSDNKRYLYGPEFVVSGTALYNFPADDYQRVIGQEYLALFQSRITSGQSWRLAIWGDSRFAGNSQTGDYVIHNNLKWLARQRGFLRGVFVNQAVSGSQISDWTETHIDTYLTGVNDPHLAIFGAGINDFYIPFGPATPATVISRMDAFLTKVRTTKGYAIDDLSLAMVVPLSAYNPTSGRDPRYIEQIRDGFKRLARKWQVCFIDGYAVAADGQNQRGLGYAADITAPEVIHQNNTGMLPIVDLIANAIFPVSGGLKGGFYIESGTGESFTAATAPSAYPIGMSVFRATPGGGGSNWPRDGIVLTINFPDDVQVQYNYSTLSTDSSVYMRKGRAGAWSAWNDLFQSDVTPGSGYTLPGGGENMRVASAEGNRTIFADGYISKTTPSTIGSGTTIATIAAGWRPERQIWGVPLAVWDGTNWEFIRASISTAGAVVTQQAVTITATRVYFAGGASWIRA